MRVLGVDPGSIVCGYGVVTVGSGVPAHRGYRYVECGVITPERGQSQEARLGTIARWLSEVITEMRPGALAVEDCFMHLNKRSALALAQARGAVLAVAGMAGLPVFSYAPATVKQSVTGRGRASKEQVAKMVQMLVGLEQTPESDAADALAVAITHAQRAVYR